MNDRLMPLTEASPENFCRGMHISSVHDETEYVVTGVCGVHPVPGTLEMRETEQYQDLNELLNNETVIRVRIHLIRTDSWESPQVNYVMINYDWDIPDRPLHGFTLHWPVKEIRIPGKEVYSR